MGRLCGLHSLRIYPIQGGVLAFTGLRTLGPERLTLLGACTVAGPYWLEEGRNISRWAEGSQ